MAEYDKIPQLTSDPVAASVGPVNKSTKEEPVVKASGARVPTFWEKEKTHAKEAVKKSWTGTIIPTIRSLLFQSASSLLSAVIFQDEAQAKAFTSQNTNTLRVNYGGMFNGNNAQTTQQKQANATSFTDNIIIAVNTKDEADMLKEAVCGCIDKYGFASSRALYEMAGLQELAKPIDENYGWKKESVGRIAVRMIDGEWRLSMPPRTAR